MNRRLVMGAAGLAATAEIVLSGCHMPAEQERSPVPDQHIVLQLGGFAFDNATKPPGAESVVAMQSFYANSATMTSAASGVVVRSSEGEPYVITAAHVIEGKDDQGFSVKECRTFVQYPSTKLPKGGYGRVEGFTPLPTMPEGGWERDPEGALGFHDQGLLKINDRSGAFDAVPAAKVPKDVVRPKIGEEIAFVGWQPTSPGELTAENVRGPSWEELGATVSPQQKEPAVSQGIVIGESPNGGLAILTGPGDQPPVRQGNSGGAAFSSNGDLVGTIQAHGHTPYNAKDIKFSYGVTVEGVKPSDAMWISYVEPVSQPRIDSMADAVVPCSPKP